MSILLVEGLNEKSTGNGKYHKKIGHSFYTKGLEVRNKKSDGCIK